MQLSKKLPTLKATVGQSFSRIVSLVHSYLFVDIDIFLLNRMSKYLSLITYHITGMVC